MTNDIAGTVELLIRERDEPGLRKFLSANGYPTGDWMLADKKRLTHLAAACGFSEGISLLALSHEDLNGLDANKQPPLFYAFLSGDLDTINALIDLGAGFGEGDAGAMTKNRALAHLLLADEIPVSAVSALMPFFTSSPPSCIPVVNALKKAAEQQVSEEVAGILLDAKAFSGEFQAAVVAAKEGGIGLLSALAARGFDFKTKDDDGLTLANHAAKNGSLKSLKLIHEHVDLLELDAIAIEPILQSLLKSWQNSNGAAMPALNFLLTESRLPASAGDLLFVALGTGNSSAIAPLLTAGAVPSVNVFEKLSPNWRPTGLVNRLVKAAPWETLIKATEHFAKSLERGRECPAVLSKRLNEKSPKSAIEAGLQPNAICVYTDSRKRFELFNNFIDGGRFKEVFDGNRAEIFKILESVTESKPFIEMLRSAGESLDPLLCEAAKEGRVLALMALLKAGCSADAALNGSPALFLAAKNGRGRAAKMLFDHGANCLFSSLSEGVTLFGSAIESFDVWEFMDRELRGCGWDVNWQATAEGLTPVGLCCRDGAVVQLKSLLQAGADPLIGNVKNGETALMIALGNYQLGAIKTLMEHVALDSTKLGIHATAHNGFSAMHFAAYASAEMIEVAASLGCDPNAATPAGVVPLQILTDCPDGSLASCKTHSQCLFKAGASPNSISSRGERLVNELILGAHGLADTFLSHGAIPNGKAVCYGIRNLDVSLATQIFSVASDQDLALAVRGGGTDVNPFPQGLRNAAIDRLQALPAVSDFASLNAVWTLPHLDSEKRFEFLEALVHSGHFDQIAEACDSAGTPLDPKEIRALRRTIEDHGIKNLKTITAGW